MAVGLRMHPRTRQVQNARHDLEQAIRLIAARHDLTDVELLMLLSAEQTSQLKYMLRAERHPDEPDKAADEA